MKNFLKISTLITFIMLSITGCLSAPSRSSDSAEIGNPAPDFTLSTLTGETITLSGLKGKPVFINFWSYT